MNPDRKAQFAAEFCSKLNELMSGWDADRGVIHGPDGALICFSDRHGADSEGHTDIEFILRSGDPLSPRLWDCVSGFGTTVSERVHSAAEIWGATSANALLEFKYSQRGQFADHFRGHDPQGILGWHCICSPVIGYGQGDTAQSLQDWWISKHAVLPSISPCLHTLSNDRPHSIKVFFGAQDVAEVRIDGDIHQDASDVLLSLHRPRLNPIGFLRVFVIALHRE